MGFKFTNQSSNLTGYLHYKRNHYNGYDPVNGDSIDTAIAKSIEWNISKNISYELPSENEMLIHRSCNFNFNPISSINYISQFILDPEYPKRITLDFAFETQNLNLIEETILDDLFVHIPLSVLDRLNTVNNHII